ncbi:hypothetical protein [Salipiger sp.]|uniref:hypothetical protein n=1 Tax=Salipiger sp. TaxID=2078585 RepID=UPI003A96EA4D
MAVVEVKDKDFYLVAVITFIAFFVLILFGLALFLFSDFLDFERSVYEDSTNGFFGEALILRERRVTFSILLRTFITGFAFVVGLALSAIGGVFILRQVTARTVLSAGTGGPPAPGGISGEATVAPIPVPSENNRWMTLQATSPGVMFMFGGIVTMLLPQYFALPIRTVEVFPLQSVALCPDPEDPDGAMRTCNFVHELSMTESGRAMRVEGVPVGPSGGTVAGAAQRAKEEDMCTNNPGLMACAEEDE